MKIGGIQIRWSEPPQTRSLEQITDIDIAFDDAIISILGGGADAVPAFYRGRQFLADCVASLHLDELAGKTIVDETSPVLVDPNPEVTYIEFMSMIMNDLIDDGNAYLWVMSRDSTGNPTRVHVIPTAEVSVNWADNAHLYRAYSWRDRNLEPNREIFHIAINRKAGHLKGRGPIAAALESTVRTAQAEEAVAKTLAEDNYTPSLVIKSGQVRSGDDAKRVLEIWQAGRDDPDRGGRARPSVTGADTEIEQITFKPVDAQWIESRNFTVQQAGRLLGIHGFFLLVESGSSLTYSTTESLFRLLLTATLRPTYLERIEQTFSRLLPLRRTARFNTDEILRADIVSRYQAHAIGTGKKGFLTVNEVRATEGLPPIAGGDEIIVPSASMPDIDEPGHAHDEPAMQGAPA